MQKLIIQANLSGESFVDRVNEALGLLASNLLDQDVPRQNGALFVLKDEGSQEVALAIMIDGVPVLLTKHNKDTRQSKGLSLSQEELAEKKANLVRKSELGLNFAPLDENGKIPASFYPENTGTSTGAFIYSDDIPTRAPIDHKNLAWVQSKRSFYCYYDGEWHRLNFGVSTINGKTPERVDTNDYSSDFGIDLTRPFEEDLNIYYGLTHKGSVMRRPSISKLDISLVLQYRFDQLKEDYEYIINNATSKAWLEEKMATMPQRINYQYDMLVGNDAIAITANGRTLTSFRFAL